MIKTQAWRSERQFARTQRHEAKRRDHHKAARRGHKTLPATMRQALGPIQGESQQFAFLRLLFALYALLPFAPQQMRQPMNYSKHRGMAYESHKRAS